MIRVVKMTFHPNKVDQFLSNFEKVKKKIRAFEGIEHLELLCDKNQSNVYFTYSVWKSEKYLDLYRKSDFFGTVWSTTKPMFIEKPAAWSLDSLIKLP